MPPVSQNRISADFSMTDQDKALKAIAAVQKLLPFLVGLSAEERKDLYGIGDKSRAFIRKAKEAAQAHPAALPRAFDEAEFRKDADLVDTLYPVVMAMRQLQNSLEDTFALAGSEAYAAGLIVYRSLRDNDADGLFEAAIDDLSARFVRKAGKKSGPSQVPASSATPPAASPAVS